jgi:hypothetical protein
VPVDVDDSNDLWTLTRTELAAVAAKSMANRLSFALLLKNFRIYGRFPRSLGDLDRRVIATLAKQIGSEVTIRNEASELDRTGKRHRAEIRAFFGFRGATVRDAQELTNGYAKMPSSKAAIESNLLGPSNLSAGDECLSRQHPIASTASCALPYMPTKSASIRTPGQSYRRSRARGSTTAPPRRRRRRRRRRIEPSGDQYAPQ